MRILLAILTCTTLLLPASGIAQDDWTMPRTPDGKPDLQGIWSNATQTPLERPIEFGTIGFLTLEQKDKQEAAFHIGNLK